MIPAASTCINTLTTEGVNVTKPSIEIPEGWTFLRQLPEKKRKAKVQKMIISCFDHLSEAHAHISTFAANMSLLVKICDPETYDMVLKATARPMIQVNIPEHYLRPVQDPPSPKTTTKERLVHLKKVLLPQANVACLVKEPRFGPTRLLTANHLVVTQMEILQQWHSQRSMHHIRGSSQAAFEANVGKSLPWWHWWKVTKHRIPRAQTHEETGSIPHSSL